MPIYHGGEVSTRVRQEVERAGTEVREAVIATWSLLGSVCVHVDPYHIQVEANKQALGGVREEEKVGQRTRLGVLNAERATGYLDP
jgi:outer membrane protein